ncbi:hypothetical protein B0H10DRAFT_1963400 [Mycena sp. CBHHK59/15]|nr:hypothetical protein B0H10DRAFT_1963400 [Mycena sp. CBHHK59/15]
MGTAGKGLELRNPASGMGQTTCRPDVEVVRETAGRMVTTFRGVELPRIWSIDVLGLVAERREHYQQKGAEALRAKANRRLVACRLARMTASWFEVLKSEICRTWSLDWYLRGSGRWTDKAWLGWTKLGLSSTVAITNLLRIAACSTSVACKEETAVEGRRS